MEHLPPDAGDVLTSPGVLKDPKQVRLEIVDAALACLPK
jgi:hypothetical protein